MVKLFVAATGLAMASATECGECWEAVTDANGDVTGQCKPKADKVKVTCGSNQMSMEIDKCLFEGTHDYNHAYIGEDDGADNCQVYNYSDAALNAYHGLQACGTTMEYNAADDQVVFKSVMHIPSLSKEGGIFITQPIDWTFQCSYSTSYDITADEMNMDASAKTGEFSGFGQFDLSMSFYTSETFEDELDSADASHQVGKSINFGVQFNNGLQLPGLNFAPTSCEVVNVENESEYYQIWSSTDEAMCDSAEHPVDFTVQQSPNKDNMWKQFFGLSFTGFAFDSATSDVGQQLLKCHVEICHDDTEDSMCKTGCFEEPSTEEPSTGPTGQCEQSGNVNSDSYELDHKIYNDWDVPMGATIQISRECTTEWKYTDHSTTHYCYSYSAFCNGGERTQEFYLQTLFNIRYIINRLHKQEDGTYLSFLNCPECGCTQGEYDVESYETMTCKAGPKVAIYEGKRFWTEDKMDFYGATREQFYDVSDQGSK